MTGSLRLPFRWGPLLLFGVLAGGLVAVEYGITQRADFAQRPALPPAVAADLLLVLPGLFYWLIVRRYQLPARTVAAAFGGGLALSHWLLPAGGLAVLAWAGRLAQGLEVVALGYTATRLRRIWRGYRAARQHSADFMENLFAAVPASPGLFITVFLTEVAVLRYGLLSFGAAPEVRPGQQAFSTYRQSGFTALLATLAGLSLLELGAAHLLVAHWHPGLAWGLTAAGIYSLLWLLAHGQAVRQRPLLLAGTSLVLRVGFSWRATIDMAHITRVQLLKDTPEAAPQLLDTARLLFTTPNVLLTLAPAQQVQGLFGRQRLVGQLAFYVDEPVALTRALAAIRP